MKMKLFSILAVWSIAAMSFASQPRQTPAPQALPGAISGTIADITGAKIPGVTVTLGSGTTGFSATTLTNESGVYRFSSVTPGADYTLIAELQGFATTVLRSIQVGANETLQFNLALSLSRGSIGPGGLLPPFSRPASLNITADRTTRAGAVTQYRGNVRMSSSAFEVSADEVDFNTTTQRADMRGNVSMRVLSPGPQVIPLSH